MGGGYNLVSARKAALGARMRELNEFTALMKKYEAGQRTLLPLKKRLRGRAGVDSPVTVIEEIGASLGMKDKLSSFKDVEESVEQGYDIRGVEVSIKGVTLNQFVNLLYEIDRYPALLLVKEMDLKTGFEDNKLMDCRVKVLLVQRAASAARS